MGDYKPKNVLITGGAGFIGSHVTINLVKKYGDYKVVVFDKLDYCATLNNLKSIQNNLNFKFIKGDILSPDLVMYVLETEQIDTVMHFAAQTHVDNSFGNSLAFTMNNTYGTYLFFWRPWLSCFLAFFLAFLLSFFLSCFLSCLIP